MFTNSHIYGTVARLMSYHKKYYENKKSPQSIRRKMKMQISRILFYSRLFSSIQNCRANRNELQEREKKREKAREKQRKCAIYEIVGKKGLTNVLWLCIIVMLLTPYCVKTAV